MRGDEQRWVLDLDEVDGTRGDEVGGKGAQLGALRRLADVRVPAGFCVTTAAFRRWRAAGAGAVPPDVAGAVADALARLGAGTRVAVRSSATAEDAVDASFAGQHASWLDVAGPAAVLDHVRRVWRSLENDAVAAYRAQVGADEADAAMAVVVQRMVHPRAAGVLFTADPVTGHRGTAAIEAVPGLGAALVAGRATPDRLAVRGGAVVAVERVAGAPTLTDAEAVALAALGRRLEEALGGPQDVEWCLDDEGFAVVQSRRVTTLFPVPDAGDDGVHLWLSVGHQQMMTDAMSPLGLSLFQRTAAARMVEAGSRLFVDVAPMLAAPGRQEATLAMLGRGDPLTGDALRTLLDRGLVPAVPGDPAPPAATAPDDVDPAVIDELVALGEASLAALEERLRGLEGTALVQAVVDDQAELKRVAFDPRGLRVITVAMEAAWWLDDHLEAWLGERGVADVLSRSVPGNVTSQMGLALLDVADAIRPHPEVVALLERAGADDDRLVERLDGVPGGAGARAAIEGWLAAYGARGTGEIDLARPRFAERPASLLAPLLGDVRAFGPGEGRRRFEAGREEAERAAADLLARVRALPDGDARAAEAARRIAQVRALTGYREHPKAHIVQRYWAYRRALLGEAGRLVAAGVLAAPEELWWLTLPELAEATRTGRVDRTLLRERERAFRRHERLHPPRVMTHEGEGVAGAYRRDDVPAGALVGLAVSAGTVEGPARVVLDLARAEVAPGDVLVTTHTDPSWSPLFVAVAGLVAEVGGRMTHGAVIAREYGLPAVVGVAGATRAIRDGQRIRVHGAEGWVELLD